MTPNQITLLRVGMAFGAVALFGRDATANLAAVALTIGAIALDALDGWVARRRGLATPLGAQLDILGDRVVENLYFTYFAVTGLVSLWVPVIFFLRGTVTDFLRGLAARAGRSGFGPGSMHASAWGRALVASRFSRGAYGALKCVCFCYLGVELALLRSPELAGVLMGWRAAFILGAEVLVLTTLAFCIARAVPVLWDGRRCLTLLERSAAAASR